MGRIGRALWRGGAFFTALLIAVFLREQGDAVDMAIIWLPTGVAVAGLWLLGLRYWWVVAAATLVQRASLAYYPSVAFPAALGSTAEAVCGVLVLRAPRVPGPVRLPSRRARPLRRRPPRATRQRAGVLSGPAVRLDAPRHAVLLRLGTAGGA
jgi:hypothetical protein